MIIFAYVSCCVFTGILLVRKGAMSVLDIKAILAITNSPEMIISTYACIVVLLGICQAS